jgi:septum formation protein
MYVSINTFILASASEARRKIMQSSFGYPFELKAADLDEKKILGSSPDSTATKRAKAKAYHVAKQKKSSLIIACDQTMSLAGQLFDKPSNKDTAYQQIKLLAGKKHYLHTAYYLLAVDAKGEAISFQGSSNLHTIELQMRTLSEQMIKTYIATGEWQGCVGGYRVEGYGAQLFTSVSSDTTAVMGLPIFSLLASLRKIGVDYLANKNPPLRLNIDTAL